MTPAEIRSIRDALAMTQTELGQAVGVGLRAVQRWETGERSPRGAALVVLGQLAARAAEKTARRPDPKIPVKFT